MILDSTYFNKVNLKIPVDNIDIDSYIQLFESDVFEKILGYSLYKEFETGVNDAIPEQKWIDLKDGATYEISGVTYSFKGIAVLAAYWIKAMIIKDLQHVISDAGIKRMMNENGKEVSPRYLFTQALNTAANMQKKLIKFVDAKNLEVADTYPNFNYSLIEKTNVFGI